MRIMLICYEDMGGYVGSNRQVMELARALKNIGHRVKIITPRINVSRDNFGLQLSYIPVINLPFFRYLSYLCLSPFFLSLEFLKFKPDVVFLFQICLDLGTFIACSFFKRPFIFYINGIPAEELALRKVPGFIIRCIEYIQGLYARYSYRIFAVTDVVREDTSIRYKVPLDKIELLSNGVDTSDFKPMDKAAARKELGFSKTSPLIGFVASLYPWQGADYLMHAAVLVKKLLPQARFIIVGKGLMYELLRSQAKELGVEQNVIFAGSVEFKKVPVYINSFDVCLVFFKPVRKNPGVPMKLYEYLACARPVIASNTKGYGDIVESIQAGLSVDASVPEELSAAIIKLLSDEKSCKIMGENGRRFALANTWENKARFIEQFLLNIKR